MSGEHADLEREYESLVSKVLAVEAIKPLTGSEGVTFGAGFASGFNHALELVAEAISSVEPSTPEAGQR